MAEIPGELGKMSYSSDGTSYTEVPGVASFTPPGWTQEEIRVDGVSATEASFRSSKKRIHEPVVIVLDYDPDQASHQALYDAQGSNVFLQWETAEDTPKEYEMETCITSFIINEIAREASGTNLTATVTGRLKSYTEYSPS